MSTDAAVGRPVTRPTAWWGTVLVIATEATLFAMLLASYFYLRWRSTAGWPPDAIPDPKLLRPGIATALLAASSVTLVFAVRVVRRGQGGRAAALLALGAALLLGTAFLVMQGFLLDASADSFRPQTNAYGSVFYAVLGLHAAHVVVGLVLALWAAGRVAADPFSRGCVSTVAITALYWHFVNAVAVVAYLVLYLTPRL